METKIINLNHDHVFKCKLKKNYFKNYNLISIHLNNDDKIYIYDDGQILINSPFFKCCSWYDLTTINNDVKFIVSLF